MGAVAWGLWPAPRFPSPLIEPEHPISGVRLSEWLHCEAHDTARSKPCARTDSPLHGVVWPTPLETVNQGFK
jgi:hypothetical protein